MTHSSPNLEIVSKTPSSDGIPSEPAAERRRVPRLSVTGEQFRLTLSGKIFSVVNLSMEGMAIRILERDDLIAFPVGVHVEGIINVRRKKYSVRGRVRNLCGDVVGFEFDGLESTVTDALRMHLDPVELGKELRPIPASDGATWYHGPSGTDLLLWRGVDGEFRRMTLFILGNYIHWDAENGIITGLAEPSEQPDEIRGVVRFETVILKPDSALDSSKLKIAKTLILSSNLSQDLQKWCIRKFEG